MRRLYAYGKRLFAAAAFIFLSLAADGVCRDGSAGPKLALPITTVDLGVSFQGEKAKGSFLIRNDGDAPLNIIEVKPSCGCTVADLEANTVPPGGEIKVGISVDTTGKTGKIKKSVAVKTDDPRATEARVEVTTEVRIREHAGMSVGQAIFEGDCARCHAGPARDKAGEPLFEAVCAMCHGHYGLGGTARRINDLNYLREHDDPYFKKVITEGKQGTSMPGFSKENGGPLDEAQVESLAALIRWWNEGYVFKTNEERQKRVNMGK